MYCLNKNSNGNLSDDVKYTHGLGVKLEIQAGEKCETEQGTEGERPPDWVRFGKWVTMEKRSEDSAPGLSNIKRLGRLEETTKGDWQQTDSKGRREPWEATSQKAQWGKNSRTINSTV